MATSVRMTYEFGDYRLDVAEYQLRHEAEEIKLRKKLMDFLLARIRHLFITDLNQSPFNIGTRLGLKDFTLAQVAELDSRYGSPLAGAATDDYRLLGGRPYLSHYGLY